MRWLGVIVLGVALGAATAASDVAAGGLHQTQLDRAAGMLLNAGFVWAGSAVLAGWLVGRSGVLAGAAAGFVVLLCAVGGYYLYGVSLGDRTDVGLQALSGVIRLWLMASLFAGPVLGITGVLTRRRDVLGALARLVVPVGAIIEMLGLRHLDEATFRVDPVQGWTQAVVVVLAALAGGWGILRRAGSWGRS